MTSRQPLSALVVTAALAVTALPADAQDGRLSLAERVARLEQQSHGAPATGSGNLELLNRLQEMQSELQSLRNLVERQAFEIEELKKRQRDQYVDLDSRIERLRGGDAAGADDTLDFSAGSAATAPPPVPPAPADPNQLVVQDAEAVDPYTGEPIPRGTDATASGGIDAGDPLTEYQVAFDALKQGRYDESTALFNDFMRKYPDHELADNAMYWLGESYYVTQRYESALETFRGLVQRYPGGEKTADAELKIGYSLYELGQYDAAHAALGDVIQRYPESTVARLAQSRLRALELERR